MTHDELVKIGAVYMRRTMRCSPVVAERKCIYTREIPDVLGWRNRTKRNQLDHFPYDTMDSVLFECKTSRADFLADFKKPFRGNSGFGRFRYYFVSPYFLENGDAEKIFKSGWGLIYWDSKKRKAIVDFYSKYFDGIDVMRQEFLMFRSLAQELERIKIGGVCDA